MYRIALLFILVLYPLAALADDGPVSAVLLVAPEKSRDNTLPSSIQTVWTQELRELQVSILWEYFGNDKEGLSLLALQRLEKSSLLAVVFCNLENGTVHVVYRNEQGQPEEMTRKIQATNPDSIAEASGVIVREQISALLASVAVSNSDKEEETAAEDGDAKSPFRRIPSLTVEEPPSADSESNGDDEEHSRLSTEEGEKENNAPKSLGQDESDSEKEAPQESQKNGDSASNKEGQSPPIAAKSGDKKRRFDGASVHGKESNRLLRVGAAYALNFYSKRTGPSHGIDFLFGVAPHELIWIFVGYTLYFPITVERNLKDKAPYDSGDIHGTLEVRRYPITLGIFVEKRWRLMALHGGVGVCLTNMVLQPGSHSSVLQMNGKERELQISVPITLGIMVHLVKGIHLFLDARIEPVINLLRFTVGNATDNTVEINFFSPYRVQNTVHFGVIVDFF